MCYCRGQGARPCRGRRQRLKDRQKGERHERRSRVSYCRTGIAKAFRGALNQTHGIPLAAHVLKKAVAKAKIESGEVDDIVLGCGLPQGATGHNIGRTASLAAGFDVPGVTVNRYCGSGLTAASMIASRIATGEIACGIAGGVESISLVQIGIAVDAQR